MTTTSAPSLKSSSVVESANMPTQLPRAQHAVLAVSLDDLTLGRLRGVTRGTDLFITPVTAGEALRLAQQQTARFLVLIEWNAAGFEEQARFCQAMRSVSERDMCSIVAVGGLSDQDALAKALDSGADEVLSRPFSGDLLLRMQRLLQRSAQRPQPNDPRQALQEALRSTDGGEVVVRAEDVTGIIHVQDQCIVWAHISSMPASMEEIIRLAGAQVDQEVVKAVKEDCRTNSRNFVEVLIQWRILDEEQAHSAVRAFVARRVDHILGIPGATALFLPKARRRVERIRFRASEFPSLAVTIADLPDVQHEAFDAADQRPSFVGMEHVLELVNKAMRVDGCVGAAILDRGTGASLVKLGEEPDTSIAWSQLMTLAALGAGAEDVIATTSTRSFVTRALAGTASLALFVIFAMDNTTVGLARASVAQLVSARRLT